MLFEALGTPGLLQESRKGTSILLVFRSFGSFGAPLGPFVSPVEPMGELKNLILGLESTHMAPNEGPAGGSETGSRTEPKRDPKWEDFKSLEP